MPPTDLPMWLVTGASSRSHHTVRVCGGQTDENEVEQVEHYEERWNRRLECEEKSQPCHLVPLTTDHSLAPPLPGSVLLCCPGEVPVKGRDGSPPLRTLWVHRTLWAAFLTVGVSYHTLMTRPGSPTPLPPGATALCCLCGTQGPFSRVLLQVSGGASSAVMSFCNYCILGTNV